MDLKQIKELISAMEKAGLKKIRIREEKGFEVELEKDVGHTHPPPVRHEPSHHFATPTAPPHHHPPEEQGQTEGNFISSPMVGTFYSSPSPDDPHYVKVGDMVDEDTVVCIIEAMKVMNEVKAGKKGKIAEILVHNADPIEFGTHLFRIV